MTIDRDAIVLEVGASGGRYLYRFDDGSEAEMAYVERRPGVVTITYRHAVAASRPGRRRRHRLKGCHRFSRCGT